MPYAPEAGVEKIVDDEFDDFIFNDVEVVKKQMTKGNKD